MVRNYKFLDTYHEDNWNSNTNFNKGLFILYDYDEGINKAQIIV